MNFYNLRTERSVLSSLKRQRKSSLHISSIGWGSMIPKFRRLAVGTVLNPRIVNL